ncbi:MAG: hypothetical protein JJU35_15160 [Balneolales bacterium]|nr:hypothetical protein [Balneolales bacterium]
MRLMKMMMKRLKMPVQLQTKAAAITGRDSGRTPNDRELRQHFFLWVNFVTATRLPDPSIRPARLIAPCTPAGSPSPALTLIGLLCLLFSIPLNPKPAEAQRLNFGLFAGDNVSVRAVNGHETLDFNLKQNPIVPGDEVAIALTVEDLNSLAIIEIEAAIGFDLDVEVSQNNPGFLLLNGTEEDDQIGFNLRWAFANQDSPDLTHALGVAQSNVVPPQISFATFPVLRRGIGSNGPPGPPPTPLDGNSPARRDTKIVYLFIYGNIFDTDDAAVGTYSDVINIHVSYNEGSGL